MTTAGSVLGVATEDLSKPASQGNRKMGTQQGPVVSDQNLLLYPAPPPAHCDRATD